MGPHGALWKAMEYYGILWNIMETHGNLWNLMEGLSGWTSAKGTLGAGQCLIWVTDV